MPLCLSPAFIHQAGRSLFTRPSISFAAVFELSQPLNKTRQVRAFHQTPFSYKSKKMPPKGKKGDEPKKVILGRPGNNLKVGSRHTVEVIRDGTAKLTGELDWYRRCSQRREIIFLQHSFPNGSRKGCQLPICHHVRLVLPRHSHTVADGSVTQRRPVSPFLTHDSTGYATSTSPNPRSQLF